MFGKTRAVKVGDVYIGGDHPISVQSMTNTDTLDFESTFSQVRALESVGCDIVRLSVPEIEGTGVFSYLKSRGISIPLVADIHFDYKIAVECAKSGVDKIRINPGNIGERWKVAEVASACLEYGIPIRIGVNGGSLDKKILMKYSSPTPEALAESALSEAEVLESLGFSDIVISIKSSRVADMIEACRIVSERCHYPLHLGVTEAGDEYSGIVKNSIGIGALLCDRIGDTIRVSLTADPIREVAAGKEILNSLELGRGAVHIVSCPTCARTKIDLISLSEVLKKEISLIDTQGKYISVALMGCVVNGPGEAREADVGVAGGNGEALLFKKGVPVCKIPEDEIVSRLVFEIRELLK